MCKVSLYLTIAMCLKLLLRGHENEVTQVMRKMKVLLQVKAMLKSSKLNLRIKVMKRRPQEEVLSEWARGL